MATYSGVQVLTVKELRIGEELHCGVTGGKCMSWTVLDIDAQTAYIRVGKGATVKMTGRDIRAGLPMFRVKDCPICKRGKIADVPRLPIVRTSDRDKTYVPVTLASADVPSSLSRVDNVRKKSNINSGGALIDTPTKRRNAVTQRIVKQIMRGM